MPIHRRLVAAAAIWTAVVPAWAAAPLPDPDPAPETVVETQLLPRRAKAHIARRQSIRAVAPAERVDAAREMIQASRKSGDPRLLGYAEAELATVPPDAGVETKVDALVLRATVQQAQHRFAAARELLDGALALQPDHAQALITRATVLLVEGRAAAARGDCERLARTAPDAASICAAGADAASGHNGRARATAESIARSGPASLRGWALSVAAEIAEMDGDPRAAVRLYGRSLAAEDDLYTRIALGNALLDASQPEAALSVLAAAPPTDAVLLARWRAARALGSPDAAALEMQLSSRFGVDAARGAPLHLREAAAFTLERGDSRTALRLAAENFASQRTAADALLLARAARAARDTGQAGVVREWMRKTGLRDARIAAATNEASS